MIVLTLLEMETKASRQVNKRVCLSTMTLDVVFFPAAEDWWGSHLIFGGCQGVTATIISHGPTLDATYRIKSKCFTGLAYGVARRALPREAQVNRANGLAPESWPAEVLTSSKEQISLFAGREELTHGLSVGSFAHQPDFPLPVLRGKAMLNMQLPLATPHCSPTKEKLPESFKLMNTIHSTVLTNRALCVSICIWGGVGEFSRSSS